MTFRGEHAEAPLGLGHHVQDVLDRQFRRRGQTVLEVLMALALYLQIERENQGRAVGSLGPIDQALDELPVLHHVELKPERFFVFSAMSSMEQILTVESVNGIPNFSAALAARISPSARCIPVSPVGASATGIAVSCPAIVVLSVRFCRLTATRCRNLIRSKSLALA